MTAVIASASTFNRPTRSPADLAKISGAVDRLYDQGYSAQWEAQTLPKVIDHRRDADGIAKVSDAVHTTFTQDPARSTALFEGLDANRTATDVVQVTLATQRVFDQGYAEAWEQQQYPKLLDSKRTGKELAVIAQATHDSMSNDPGRASVLETGVASSRPATDVARIARAVDQLFTQGYQDAWTQQAFPKALESPRSATEVSSIGRTLNRTFTQDPTRGALLEPTLKATRRSAPDISRIAKSLDSVFVQGYAEAWQQKFLPVALGSDLETRDVVAALRSTAKLALGDVQSGRVLEDLLSRHSR